jgi:major type 1 subunit fimbrin (pilin)
MKAKAFFRATWIGASILMSTIGAHANDGTVTVTGTVAAETCTINFNNLGANIQSGTVTLPPVAKSSLSSNGNTAAATAFTIAVSGCTGTGVSTMNTYFDPSSSAVNANGRLTSTGTATNVDVQILGSNQAVINLSAANGSQGSTAVALVSGAAVQTFYARYFATNTAGPGTISTSVGYTLVYV